MNENFKSDYYRMTGNKWNSINGMIQMLLRYDLRYLHLIRRKKSKIRTLFAMKAARKYGLEILSDDIGPGLYLGHAHNINVSPLAKIGKNCNLNKGCTIGRENRGKRIGAPTLEDNVWVGSNSMVVGNVHIGSDVLIAPTGRWNGNEIGMNAAMALMMILYLFPKAKNLFLKMYYCIIVSVSLYLIYWMGSRKTIVFLILGVCGVILLKKPKKIIKNLLLVCCIITVSWNLLMEVPSLYQNVGWRLEALTFSITGKGKADSSTLLREKYIEVGIDSFKKSPIIGYGVASFSEINEHKTNHHTYSHNNFIEVAVGLGIIGFVSYYWIYVYLIIKYLKLFIHKRTSFLVNVLFVLFILYLATQVGLVTYESLIQWLLILFLYKAMEFNQNSYRLNR